VNTVGTFFNGRTSRVDISIQNTEPQKITVNFIGGAFQDIATLKPVLNVPFPTPQLTFLYGRMMIDDG